MARLQTQLFRVSSGGFTWADNININNATALFRNNGSDSWTFEDLTNVSTPLSDTTLATNGLISLLNDGLRRDDFDVESGIYTFEDGKSNRFQTATINATNTTYNLTTIAANIYTITLDGVVYKFNLNDNGFEYYVNDKPRGSLTNQGAASGSFNNGLNCYFTLSQHKGKLIFATSTAGDYFTATGEVVFDGYLPFLLGSDATPTPTPEPTPQPSTDIDLNSGFGEKDLTTNIITYFAKQFKLKASDFVMNSDGIVEINPDKLASITVDLTNIVNTSITTQNLTATTSSIGTATAETLTTDGLTATTSSLGQSSASKMEVGTGGLIWTDAQGHKHQFVSE